MTSESLSDNVHRFRFECESRDTVPALIISDVHYDSIKCKRKLLKSHLDEIVEKDGLIFIFGDWFDIMATYGDKRMKREGVDSRYIVRGRSYLDVVIEDSIEFLSPYAENIAMISTGNHETSIQKHCDTDPIFRLVTGLNRDNGTDIQRGAYSGYIFMCFKYSKGGSMRTKTIHYHHGFGGNAKRSKGMLDVQIEVMKYPDADLLCRGHDHQKWYDPSTTRFRVSSKTGEITKDSVAYLKTGSYKDGLEEGKQGWEVEKNFLPTKMGGWFVNFDYDKHNGVKITPTEAN